MIQYVDCTASLINGSSVVVATPQPQSTKPVNKFRTRQWVNYRSISKGTVRQYVVMWIGPDSNDPSKIKVGLKTSVGSRMRLFYVDQDACWLA